MHCSSFFVRRSNSLGRAHMPGVLAVSFLMLSGTALGGPAPAARVDGPNAATETEAAVAIPPYPYTPNETIVVDSALVDQMAGEYCAEASDPTGEDFLFGYLPLETFDTMCGASQSEIAQFLGNLYLSGYFGGVWLRDTLDEESRTLFLERAGATWGQAFEESAQPGSRTSEDALFRLLVRAATLQVRLAEQGGAAAVLANNRGKLPGLLSIYGYNLGYTQFMLAAPPDGIAPMDDVLVCGDYVMDCDSPDIDLALLDRFRAALGPLQYPYNVRWAQMDGLVQEYAAGSVAMGEAVWEDIMSSSTLSADAYPMLIDLSVGFLLVSDAAALGGITAWATQDVSSGRCALLAETGLTVWSASYFMGLLSSAPEGTGVSLSCPKP